MIDGSADERAEVRRLLVLGSEVAYVFTEAETGAAGVGAALGGEGAPDCVVLGHPLPDMDTTELLAALRGSHGHSICPVVVLSSAADLDARRRVLRAGAHDYLDKAGLSPQSLTRAIEHAIERWAMAQELHEQRLALEASEARLRALLEQSRESEACLRLALEASHTGIWTWDLKTDKVIWSAECREIMGFAPGAFEGTGAAFFRLVHPEDFERVNTAARQAIAEGVAYRCEFRIVRPDGSTIWVENIGRAREDESGERVGMLGTVTNISDRREAEATLRAARDHAEQLAKSRSQLVSVVSHDLRSPLSAVMMGIEILQRSLDGRQPMPADRLTVSVERMARQTKRMEKLINELLDVAGLHAGKPLLLARQKMSLVELVRGVADGQRPVSSRHKIEVQAGEDPLMGEWDPQRLERVVYNLLSYAVKYSPAGGDVLLSLEPAEIDGARWAVLRVTDHGLGIPAAERSTIFDWFSRASNTRSSIPGAGIGLAGATQIIVQHGGSISVESEEGKGSTFTVRLPP